jgi:gamma-glutamyltranspeptidase/glutathione hydrolase
MHGRRPTISSVNGVVAAAHPLAAQAGARILSDGGNAFDAAAATAAALNVVEPYMSGLAGQGLATCWVAKEKRIRVLDFVPRVPQHFPVDRFKVREDLARGPLSVGTPGNFGGWAELVRAHGKKSIGDTLAPAIKLARDGFPLIEFNIDEMNEHGPAVAKLPFGAECNRVYMNGGKVAHGQVLRQPDLAKTLEALARDGAPLLYGGALGHAIVDHLASLGGCMTMADLESFKPVWKDPVAITYRGHTVHVPPPPCEGFQFLLTLRILEGFDLAKLARNGVDHLDTVYRAIRLAAGVRIANANPDPQKLARLLGDDHVNELRARARRQARRGPDRAVDGAGRGRRPRPHHVVLHRRCRRQSHLRDAKPRQPVRQRRRGARHRALPQQLPVLDRGQSEVTEPRQGRQRAQHVRHADDLDA